MRPAPIDPPEIDGLLWAGFEGTEDDFAWDVGSNCGQSVPKMLMRFGNVACFEPARESYDVLERAYGHHERVRLHPAALTDASGKLTLCDVPEKISTGQLVTANQFPEATAEVGPSWTDRIVPCYSGDDLVEEYGYVPPAFMKIDVEGHEVAVLNGCQRLLVNHMPAMLIEIHTRQLGAMIYRAMHELGYRIETVRHPHYAPYSAYWSGHFWLRCFAR